LERVKIMPESKTPKEFFEKDLSARFKPEKAKGVDVTAQVSISGSNGGDWTITIKNQQLQVVPGIHDTPVLVLKASETDFMDIINGKLSAERAFFSGRINFKGNITVALKLRDAGLL
jgi:putative sterol carrier protein